MSTFTPKFSLEKPALTDQANADVWRNNTHKIVHAIKNIELETNAGFAQRSASCIRRTTVTGPLSSDTNDNVWYGHDAPGNNWFNVGDATMGRLYQYTSQNAFQFEHPGIYRIGFNLRVQFSGVTHTEGSLRAAMYYAYGDAIPPVYVPGTHTQVPAETYLGAQDIYCETLVYASEYNEIDRMIYNYGDDVGYSASTAPNAQWEVRWGMSNDNSLTVSTVADYCFIHAEFVRAI